MRFGPKLEKGFLPVYSVDSEEEARDLLVRCCPRNMDGEFIAPELAQTQSLENLYTFGERLEREHARMMADRIKRRREIRRSSQKRISKKRKQK